MPKYLIAASYTADGVKGLLKAGGSARADAVRKMVEGLGGRLESFYFAFGSDDVYATADMPDNVTAAAVGLAVSSSGLVSARTTVLLTPEELDAAAKLQVAYAAPGK
jgi:uncharacterized protein with GYD domain